MKQLVGFEEMTLEQQLGITNVAKMGIDKGVVTESDLEMICNGDRKLFEFVGDYFLIRKKWLSFQIEF